MVSNHNLAALASSFKDLKTLANLSLHFEYMKLISTQFYWLLKKGFEFEYGYFNHSSAGASLLTWGCLHF
jgi:hypothetical protein